MDVKAIILVGGDRDDSQGELAGLPIAFADVLGAPVVQRVLERLEHFGITAAAVLTETDITQADFPSGTFRPGLHWQVAKGAGFWRAAENVFNDFAQSGADLVLAVRLGPYVEIDYEDAIQWHLDQQCRITSVTVDGKEIGTFVISAHRRNDAAYLFRHELREMRQPCVKLQRDGYVNWLRTPKDLRLLALDSFAGLTTIQPRGTEIKPGVWKARSARVHRRARVLAPAYIGPDSKIRAAAVVTRGSVVEHHAEVDCGTVIENSTVLPMTKVGAGLDVTSAVIGRRRVWSLKRNIEVEISDEKLVGTQRSAAVRTISNTAELAFFMAKLLSKPIFGKRNGHEPDLVAAVRNPAPAFNPNDELTENGRLAPATDFLTARRYGNE